MAESKLVMLVDTKRCIACNSCAVACKVENNLPKDVWWNRVMTVGGPHLDAPSGTYPNLEMYNVTVACQHCENPSCLEACPTGATMKDEETGVVYVDDTLCIGCKSCIQACPYGAPQFVEAKGVTEKCDMCAELRSYGEEPACVAICPQRALKVGDIDELRAEFGDCADVAPLPSSADTAPNVVIVAHRNAKTNLADVRILSLEQ